MRTYAPLGQTPIIRAPLSREHLSVMGAISSDGGLYFNVQERAFRSEDVVKFLEHLLIHIGGRLTVVWDGAPIHRSNVIKEYLRQFGAGRIHLEQFPGYAPELNPAEGIWAYLKRVELKNLCCADIAQLRRELRKGIERLRHKMDVIAGCLRQPGYY